MPKKVAVLIRERQGEALRMALGITLMDDIIEVFVLNKKIEETEQNIMNIQMLKDLEMTLYTNVKENEGLEYLSTGEIAKKLLECDHILPY